jgi:ATP-binding cassette, subfamily B, bacterial PglK
LEAPEVTNIRKALHLIGRENRGRWILLILFALVSSGLEVVGAALVFLLLGLIADPAGAAALPLIGDIRRLVPLDEDALLLGLAGVMAVFFVVRAFVHVGEIYAQNRVAHNAGARLATKMVVGYLKMPYAFHLRRNSSDLIRNSHQATRALVSQIFLPVIRVTAETILVTAMLVLLVLIAPAATGLAVLVIGGAVLAMLLVVQPRLKRLGRTAHEMEKQTLGALQQSFHGIRDIKILGRERSFARRYQKARKRLARASYLNSTASDLPRTIMELALLGFILIVFTASTLFQEDSASTLSVLGLFAYTGIRLQPSLQRIIAGLNHLKFATAPVDDVFADLALIAGARPDTGDGTPLPFEHQLRFDQVSFRYDGAHVPALDGIELTIEPGEFVGICGPTGGGKTTLVDLMTGLLEPTSGSILVDGLDLRQHARSWQRNLGVVPQMVFLTDETLRENIALGIPRSEIDEEAVQEAVELAQLAEFVSSLPQGLETFVGERGVRVSGGQRQRIAIARALYHRPEVLVFDEGTSALDNTTEKELMAALAHLRGAHTIVMIAHRLSTVRDADRIAMLEHGRMTGFGTYGELVTSNAAFRKLTST